MSARCWPVSQLNCLQRVRAIYSQGAYRFTEPGSECDTENGILALLACSGELPRERKRCPSSHRLFKGVKVTRLLRVNKKREGRSPPVEAAMGGNQKLNFAESCMVRALLGKLIFALLKLDRPGVR